MGDDRPYSLFLATGVPFEVTSKPSTEGWTFLSDADAAALDRTQIPSPGTVFLSRLKPAGARQLDESMADLFRLKAELMPKLRTVSRGLGREARDLRMVSNGTVISAVEPLRAT